MLNDKFIGTGVAMITPFREDKSIDFNAMEKLLNHLLSNNVDFLVALGTTGECVTLSKDERKAVVNYTIEYNNGKVPVVVGMGGYNTQEVVNTIHEQNFAGIDAILSVAPYYNKPSQEGLFQHFKAIASASPVPVIVYNVPGRTGINMNADTTLRLANSCENIIAVKEASGNMNQIMKIIGNRPENFLVLSGDDALTLPMIGAGANGVISVIGNAFPNEFSEMVDWALNERMMLAHQIHYKLFDLMIAIFEEGSPAGIKAAMEILGIASNNLRLPITPVSKGLYKTIEELIAKIKSKK
ncbi:MAG: 4-hydroxy-tetrahydrodipicolinate synthase [Bacteroidales bacterium]|nr:4-hydroxy-tetrahydrodipicolinate synthase [Bacteroidales bacterium]